MRMVITLMRQSSLGWIAIALVAGLAIAGAWIGVVLATAPAHAATVCMASFYGGGKGERLARHTASGEVFDYRKMTAAHRSLPFGTRARVTWHGRSVMVRISDRGPAKQTGRCIDLSRGAASALGMIRAGVARVRVDVLN